MGRAADAAAVANMVGWAERGGPRSGAIRAEERTWVLNVWGGQGRVAQGWGQWEFEGDL